MFEVLGWQVGINYQAPGRDGLSEGYLLRLLDEMGAAGMNLLSLMMVSQAFHDAEHDGYAWPVRNERLRCYVDPGCTNARPETEFVSRIIEEAGRRGIGVQLFLTGPWWTSERIRQGYPEAHPVVDSHGVAHAAHFCLDSPGAWRACLDEALDLLEFYNHPNVRSFGVEMVGFEECHCPYTREAYRQAFDADLEDAPSSLLFGTPIPIWNTNRAATLLGQLVQAIREVRPGIEVWLHTQGLGLGHMPHKLGPAGIDTLLPLDHFYTREAEAHQLLEFLAPNPCVVHLCARTAQPLNYPLPPKTPERVRAKINWYAGYGGDNLRGLLFFNEPVVPPENKRAIYEALRELERGPSWVRR